MDSVIDEYKTYLETILADHNTGKLQFSSVNEKKELLGKFEEDFTVRSNQKAIELFQRQPREELSALFRQASREYFHKFLMDNKFR